MRQTATAGARSSARGKQASWVRGGDGPGFRSGGEPGVRQYAIALRERLVRVFGSPRAAPVRGQFYVSEQGHSGTGRRYAWRGTPMITVHCHICAEQHSVPDASIESTHRSGEGLIAYLRCNAGHWLVHQLADAYPMPEPPASVLELRARLAADQVADDHSTLS